MNIERTKVIEPKKEKQSNKTKIGKLWHGANKQMNKNSRTKINVDERKSKTKNQSCKENYSTQRKREKKSTTWKVATIQPCLLNPIPNFKSYLLPNDYWIFKNKYWT
jgi:hypothetical protein